MATKTTRSAHSTTKSPRSAKPRLARTAHKPLRPFTVDHWRKYAGLLVLDNGENWDSEDFENEFVADLFSGVPEIWLIVPEGNGKTTLLSGVALYHGDYTQDAAVLMAASSRDQCGLLLSQAMGFVRRSPGFDKRFRTYDGYRRIDCLRTHGEIQVFAADDRTGDGVIPTLALLDELHRHRSLRLYRTWRGKLDKRDGQLAAISTAGEPGSEFEITRERARTEASEIAVDDRHVRAASPEMVLHDFALRVDDDPEDLKLVERANPFSGVTEAKLRRKRASPSMTVGHWRRFVCNLATRTEGAAVGEAEWLGSELDEEIVRGRPCDVGLDLGWKWDATALVPLFSAEWGWLFGKSRVITPPRDGNSLRPEVIQVAFEAIHEETPIQRVVMDPSAGGEQLAGWLEDDLGVQVVSHSQKTGPMAVAAGRFMETLRDGTQKHVRDADFTRHVLNGVAKELPDGTFKFVRPVASRSSNEEAPLREIDALIAGSMVLSTAMGATSYAGPLMELLG
jgi:phage terminase large subunit-like protein